MGTRERRRQERINKYYVCVLFVSFIIGKVPTHLKVRYRDAIEPRF